VTQEQFEQFKSEHLNSIVQRNQDDESGNLDDLKEKLADLEAKNIKLNHGLTELKQDTRVT
jgi:hypothetical protein